MYDNRSLFKRISGKYKNLPIKNIDKLKLTKNNFIYHAGTSFRNKRLVSNGGRVLM